MTARDDWPGVSPIKAGLRARCPRCGEGRLYHGLTRVVETCDVCGLDLTGEDSGDGAAAFLIFLVGAAAVGVAVWLELSYTPPLWVHLLYMPVLVVGLTLLLLRPAKATLIALQYQHKAGEGRRIAADPPDGDG